MTAHARATDKPTSQRAAERCNAVDPNKPSQQLHEAVRKCMESSQTKVGGFCPRDIESLMAFSDAGKRIDSEDERWCPESVRRCFVWMERRGDLILVDDTWKHQRYRLAVSPVSEPQPVATQREMF